jgi:hypothetical protein
MANTLGEINLGTEGDMGIESLTFSMLPVIQAKLSATVTHDDIDDSGEIDGTELALMFSNISEVVNNIVLSFRALGLFEASS